LPDEAADEAVDEGNSDTPAVQAETEITTATPEEQAETESSPESPDSTTEAVKKPEEPEVKADNESTTTADEQPEAQSVPATSPVTSEDQPETETTTKTSDLKSEADTGSATSAEEITPETKPEPLAPVDARFSFAGSDTIGLGLLPFLLEDYASKLNASVENKVISDSESLVNYTDSDDNESGSVYISATRSGDAISALETKATVFGMTSRQINNEEARRLSAAGSGDLRNSEHEHVIALDSLAVITHPSNPISGLSMVDLAAIYNGQIDSWSQVGGPDLPITVLSREDGSGTRSAFESIVFGGEKPVLADYIVYPGGDNAAIAAAVKKDPLAIGYVSFAFSDGLNRLNLTGECGITSEATSFAVKTEEYPLARRLYFYNREDNIPEEAKHFLEYVLSPDADEAITESDFVNFAIERKPVDPARYNGLYEGRNKQSMEQLSAQRIDDLNRWDRFSTTVRFRAGSFIMANKARSDIDRLVNTLSELPEGTQIAAVGFTDNVGRFEDNLRMSRLRAQSVADVLNSIARERRLKVKIDTRYFSELSPADCKANTSGHAINRRVEIWIRR